MPEPKWIRFVELDEYRDRVTKRWRVLSKDSAFPIGIIKWYSAWRRYCLFTLPGGKAIFEEQCLRDIALFLESATQAQRETWKKRSEERKLRAMPDIIVDLRTALAKIYERPCQCVRCSECRGLGNVLVGFRGGPPDYDDLDDLETCDQCNGGIVEVCQRCMEAEEIEEQITEEEERRSK